MKRTERTQRRGKLRVVRIVLTEILIMAVGVLCCIMPMPWRLIVPIIIGARSILIKAHARLKEPLQPEGMIVSTTEAKKEKGNAENRKANQSKIEVKANTKTAGKATGKADGQAGKTDSKKAACKDGKK